MVALLKTKPREQRHYPLGPIHQYQPLRVFNENAADLRDNLSRPVPWWVELAMAVGGLVLIGLLAFAGTLKWWMQ